MKKVIALALLMAATAHAEVIGSVTTNGLFIKDKIKVEAFDDPDIEGVSCYLTRYDRWNPTEEDSGSTSLSCRQVGPIHGDLSDNPNVFSSRLNIFFKSKIVSRFYDEDRDVLVYLAYTKKMSGPNKSHSLSVVPIRD